MIPKCKSAEVIRLVAEVVGGAQSTIGIVPMAEPARAIFIADDMAQAQERVCGLFFGSADPTADLKAEGCWGKLAFARSWIGAAAVSMGIAAIDAPYFKGDDAGLEREAAASRKLGMTGKAALYADQLATINAVFTATAEAVPRAGSEMAACAASDVRTRVIVSRSLAIARRRECQVNSSHVTASARRPVGARPEDLVRPHLAAPIRAHRPARGAGRIRPLRARCVSLEAPGHQEAGQIRICCSYRLFIGHNRLPLVSRRH